MKTFKTKITRAKRLEIADAELFEFLCFDNKIKKPVYFKIEEDISQELIHYFSLKHDDTWVIEYQYNEEGFDIFSVVRVKAKKYKQ